MKFITSNTLITYALLFRDVALTVLSVGSLCLSILWVSAFLYGSFYFFYMPSQTYEVPLNFKFDPCSEDKDAHRGSKCSFLYANVSFCGSGEPGVEYTLSHGQSYEVSLELVMPRNENNLQVGMFMACIVMKDLYNVEIRNKCMSAIMEHRSDLAQAIRTIFTYPIKILTGSREKSLVSIDFFDNFYDNPHISVKAVSVILQSRHIDVYEAKLRIHAHFTSLRYLMYYYPVITSCLAVSFIGVILSSVLAVIWKRFFEASIVIKVDTLNDQRNRARAVLEKSPRQLKVIQRVKSSSCQEYKEHEEPPQPAFPSNDHDGS